VPDRPRLPVTGARSRHQNRSIVTPRSDLIGPDSSRRVAGCKRPPPEDPEGFSRSIPGVPGAGCQPCGAPARRSSDRPPAPHPPGIETCPPRRDWPHGRAPRRRSAGSAEGRPDVRESRKPCPVDPKLPSQLVDRVPGSVSLNESFRLTGFEALCSPSRE
jgi:hypothetical protein